MASSSTPSDPSVTDPGVYTLVGDLVGSKQVPDRDRLQDQLEEALEWANEHSRSPLQPLVPTLGDEFQGVFVTLAEALYASLLVRLRLYEDDQVEVRIGIGFGEIKVYDDSTRLTTQDGPGWWAARAALDRATEMGNVTKSAVKSWTWFESAPGPGARGSADVTMINSFLQCRDALVQQMSARQKRILLGSFSGYSREQIAAAEGIGVSAVSQSLKRSGATTIMVTQEQIFRFEK